VVTIDVALSGCDGLQLATALRDRDNDLGIVVLTSIGADEVLFRALDTGASPPGRSPRPDWSGR
jgi:FixJ family two-component response regulator